MSEASDNLRRWLERHGGSATTTVGKLVGTWDAQTRREQAGPLTEELTAAGIEVDPPLAECGPDTTILVRLAEPEPEPEPEPAPEPEAEPAAEPEARPRARPGPALLRLPTDLAIDPALLAAAALGLFALLLALAADANSVALGLALIALGAVAVQHRRETVGGRRSDPWAMAGTALLAVAAVAVGVAGLAGGGDEDGGAQLGSTRIDFCASKAGDDLSIAETAGIDRPTPRKLTRATDDALDVAGRAPAGTDCAVFALDTLARAWGAQRTPGARAQVRRIRAFQREHDLARPRF